MNVNYSCISFDLEFEWIPSENFLYRPARSGYKLYLRKDTQVAEFQEKIIKHLKGIEPYLEIPERDEFFGIFAFHKVYFEESRYWKRDVENTTKALNDAFFSFLKESQERNGLSGEKILDDSQIISQYCEKGYSNVPRISSSYYFIQNSYHETVWRIMNDIFNRLHLG